MSEEVRERMRAAYGAEQCRIAAMTPEEYGRYLLARERRRMHLAELVRISHELDLYPEGER